MRGQSIAFDEKKPLVPANLHARSESLERRGRGRMIVRVQAFLRQRRLCEEKLRRLHRPVVMWMILAAREIVCCGGCQEAERREEEAAEFHAPHFARPNLKQT